MTHHDAERFEDVEFTHGTGAVLVQPGVHTYFMEDMSAETQRHFSREDNHEKDSAESLKDELTIDVSCCSSHGDRDLRGGPVCVKLV